MENALWRNSDPPRWVNFQTSEWITFAFSFTYAVTGATGSPQKEYGYRAGQMLIVAQASPSEIRWLVTDHLGSPRINVRGTGADGGSLASLIRHDYLPFGEEQIGRAHV